MILKAQEVELIVENLSSFNRNCLSLTPSFGCTLPLFYDAFIVIGDAYDYNYLVCALLLQCL